MEFLNLFKSLLLLSTFFCFFLALGLILLTIDFLSSSEKVQGTVIEVVRERDKKTSGYVYRPKIEYMDKTGTKHVFESSISSSVQRYSVDEKVGVLYNKNHKIWKEMIDNWEVWFAPITVLLLGIASAVILAFSRRINIHRKL